MNNTKVYLSLLVSLFFFFVFINTNIASAAGDKQENNQQLGRVSVKDRIKALEQNAGDTETTKHNQQTKPVAKTVGFKVTPPCAAQLKEKFEAPGLVETKKSSETGAIQKLTVKDKLVHPNRDGFTSYPSNDSSLNTSKQLCSRPTEESHSYQMEGVTCSCCNEEEDSNLSSEESFEEDSDTDEEDTYYSDEKDEETTQLEKLILAKTYDTYGNLTTSSRTFGIAENLLTNPRFENRESPLHGWENYTVGDKGYIRLNPRKKMSGTHSAQIVTDSTSNQDGCIALTQLIPVSPNETYTLSGYIKTKLLNNAFAFLNVLQLQTTDENIPAPVTVWNEESKKYEWAWSDNRYSKLTGTHDWTRHQLTFTTQPETSLILVFLEIDHKNNTTSGSAKFDHIQLERGDVPTAYNFVENSSFEQDLYRWYKNPIYGHGVLDTQSIDGGQSIKFSRLRTTDPLQQLSQDIYLHQSNPEPITITGLSKAIDAQNAIENGPNEDYGIAYDAIDYDGNYQCSGTVSFNLGAHDWERAAETITPSKAIKLLKIYPRFGGNNTGTVWFDHIRVQTGRAFTKYKYNPTGNITKITDPIGNSCYFAYDKNILTCTDPRGHNWNFVFNNNNLQAIELPTGVRVEYIRGELGNLIGKKTTSKDGLTTYNEAVYSYNPEEQQITLTNPLGLTTTIAYLDNTGGKKIDQTTYPDGSTMEEIYDSEGRIVGRFYNRQPRYIFSYDDDTNRVQVDDVELNQIKTINFDSLDRITKIATAVGTVLKSYTEQNLDQQQIIQGNTVYIHSFQHNTLGQNTRIQDPSGNKYYVDFDENGNIVTLVLGNGSASTIVHDDNERVTNIKITKNDGSKIASYDYDYDENNNITSVEDYDGNLALYEFDELEQLISETDPITGNRVYYTYSAAGNRTKKIVKNSNEDVLLIVDAKFNQANQLTQVSTRKYHYDEDRIFTHTVSNNQKLLHDQNGNMVFDGLRRCIWDTESRLKEVNMPGLKISYAYDELGRRTLSVVNGQVTNFIYDGNSINVLYETDANNQLKRYYTYTAAGKLLSMTELGRGTFYYHTNAHGDVTAITDQFNHKVAMYTYDAWGNTLYKDGYFADENPYRYAGYRYDKETRLYYLIARYYNPKHGNFLSLDPYIGDLEDLQSQNGYNYVGNNPVMKIDPDGQCWLNVAFAIYDGYQEYRNGGSIGEIALAAGVGFLGGGRIKAAGKIAVNIGKYVANIFSKGSKKILTNGTKAIPKGPKAGAKPSQAAKPNQGTKSKQPAKPKSTPKEAAPNSKPTRVAQKKNVKLQPKTTPKKIAPRPQPRAVSRPATSGSAPKRADTKSQPSGQKKPEAKSSEKSSSSSKDDDHHTYTFKGCKYEIKQQPARTPSLKVNSVVLKRSSTALKYKVVGRNLKPAQKNSVEYFLSRVQKCSKDPSSKPPVPKKLNGGMNEDDFITPHAYKRHTYNPTRQSKGNRTQYGKDVDVRYLVKETLTNPDRAYSELAVNNRTQRVTIYEKEFSSNISTHDTPTSHHTVLKNLDNPKNTSCYPYIPKDGGTKT